MDEGTRELLEPLPPSAKLVYYVLDEEGRFDQTGLAEETRLSTRTVRFASRNSPRSGSSRRGSAPRTRAGQCTLPSPSRSGRPAPSQRPPPSLTPDAEAPTATVAED